jgi:hypothetical protein
MIVSSFVYIHPRACLTQTGHLEIGLLLRLLERLSITAILGYRQGMTELGVHGFSLPSCMVPILVELIDHKIQCTEDVIWGIVGILFEVMRLLFMGNHGAKGERLSLKRQSRR